MPLDAGTRLSFYEIIGPLGAGGMGEVYRARDTRLEREVAIKVLPADLMDDEDRLRRFEREAKTLASLNHPHVAGIYGVDQVDDVCLLALELVPGEDLAALLSRGRLPLGEALDICRQIAEGLEAAHEAGVVHRDLKPANVRITPDGAVKLLDFGLAKPMHTRTNAGGTSSAEVDSFLMTEEGLVLGTPTYMSPEQARAKPVDRRTDVWAFGCVLYECLTGSRPFGGDSLTDVLAAIIEREPDWSALPADTPPAVRELLRRCLLKDARQRLRDIGEARIVLEHPLEPMAAGDAGLGSPPRMTLSRGAGWVVALLATALATWLLTRGEGLSEPGGVSRPVTRFVLEEPLADPGYWGGNLLAVSDDGRFLAYTNVAGDSRVFLRALDAFAPTPIPGSEGARAPFFSPDGAWLGYWSGGALRKVPTAGGPATTIASVDAINSAAWVTAERIVYGEQVGRLLEVDVASGDVAALTEPDASKYHDAPDASADGRALLLEHDSTLSAARMIDGAVHGIGLEGDKPRWVSDGELLYLNDDLWLCAAPIDPDTLQVIGESVTVLPEPIRSFDVSREGTLVYVPGRADPSCELVWVDRQGVATPAGFTTEHYMVPRLSPDGRAAAVAIKEPLGDPVDLWVLDLDRGSRTRITTTGDWNIWPVWTHGGSRIVYMTSAAVWWMAADGSGSPRRLFEPDSFTVPTSWDEGSQALAYYDYGDFGNLLVYHGDQQEAGAADGELETFLATPFDERSPRFSPDGRWIAYVSDQSGLDEIYVRPYARDQGSGARLAISTGGGSEPCWSADGSELFYRRGTQMFAVSFEAGPPPMAGTPQLLFDVPYLLSPVGRGNANYDVAADGRFLMLRSEAGNTQLRVHVVQGWEPP